jgi:TatD DNase family protein
MNLFTDTHCHLDFDSFDQDRLQVLDRAWESGLVWILNPGIDLDTSQVAIDLAQQFPQKVNAAVGIHPNHGEGWSPDLLPKLQRLAQQPEVVAIGEIGLDFYRDNTAHDQQILMLKAHLDLAQELNLPVVLHNRESTDVLIAILIDWVNALVDSNHPLAEAPGVLHSYTGDLETAKKAIEMNFYIGISGPVTFTNAPERKSITAGLPLDHLLLETDAPFLAPHPHRGNRNEPAYIPLIAEEIARLHQTSLEFVAETTYANAMRLFKPHQEL